MSGAVIRPAWFRWVLPVSAVAMAAGVLLGREAVTLWPGVVALVCALAAVGVLRGQLRGVALVTAAVALGFCAGVAGYHPPCPTEGTATVQGIVSGEIVLGEKGQVKTTLCDVTIDGRAAGSSAYWSYYSKVPEGLEPGVQVTMTARVYLPSGADNPGGFDFQEYLLQRGMTFGVYGCEDMTVSAADGFSLTGAMASLRHGLTNGLVAVMGQENGGYAAAMLLGSRSLITEEDRDAFSRVGVAHLLSVSGFHVAVLAWLLTKLLGLLRVPRRVNLVVTAVVLGAYCLLTGGNAPVIRAAVLLVLSRFGVIRHRRSNGLHLLAASAMLVMLFSPAQVTGASFQLTYGAMLGLMLVTPWLESRLTCRHRVTHWLWRSVCASLGAQTGILLPMLYWFGDLPVLSVVLNVVILPYGMLLLAVYWAVLFLMAVPGVGALLGMAASFLTTGLTASVRALDTLPWISLWVKQANGWTAVGWLLLLSGMNLWQRDTRRRWVCVLAGCAVTALSLVVWPHAGASYLQLSVGSADSAVLWDRDEVTVIDTGEDGEALATYLHQRRLGVDRLILTHLHSDHAGGIAALMDEGIPVKTCYVPWGGADAEVTADMKALVDALAARGTEMRTLARGDVLTLPDGTLTVVWPESGKVRPAQDANESSLTLRGEIMGTTMLLTGDLDGRYEDYAALPADILKAAHHGSKASTGEQFLREVAPQVVLLSCGDDARQASMAERCGDIPLYGTRVMGAVTVTFSPGGYTVQTMRQQTE